MGEVLPVGDQALVQLTGEHGDAVRASVVAKPVTGEADLAAAGGTQHLLIEKRPLFCCGWDCRRGWGSG